MKIEQSIRRLFTVFIFGFAIVGVSLGYWQVIRADELTNRQDNPRLMEAQLKVQRGKIFDRNGKVLVENSLTDNGYVKRVYDQPTLAPVTGFISPRFGPTGLEKTYNDVLSGEKTASPLDVLDEKVFHRPTIGSDISLTIDLDLQKLVEQQMGKSNGAIIVLNPKTGEILAMASRPTFDPNKLVFDPTVSDQDQASAAVDSYWKSLNSDSLTPLMNRATQGLYTPGSTFKTVTLAAALEQGIAQPSTYYNFQLNPPNAQHAVAWHANQYVSCENHPQASSFDLAHAYAYSCNVVFSELGLKLGSQTYLDYTRKFGLGEVPISDLPASTSVVAPDLGFFSGDERYYALASTSMGQGELSVTPLQMALVASGIANGGVIPKPYLVSEVRSKDGTVLSRTAPSVWKTAINPSTAKTVKDIMVLGVDEGWSYQTKIPGVKIAGKTGTAELGPGSKPHSWFIGFAPADDPQVAIVVMKEYSGYGSEEAAPAAKPIFQAVLQQQGKK